MKKILLVYATLTGYTQSLVEQLYTNLSQTSNEYCFDLANITDVTIDKMKEYEMIVLGASTWDGNMNPDVNDFFDRFVNTQQSLTGVRFALFGVGDRLYPDFCGAIDTIKKLIISNKGTVHGSIPKIDSYMDNNIIDSLTEWLKDIL